VGYETSIAKGPEQLVQLPGTLPVRGIYVHGVLHPVRFLREATGEELAGRFPGSREKIEVDACHHSTDHAQRFQRTLAAVSKIHRWRGPGVLFQSLHDIRLVKKDPRPTPPANF
jgi:hypothetical protein